MARGTHSVTDFERRDHLQTLERGLSVLVAFSDAGPLMSLSDLSSATGLTKPTVRRVLLTLERLGYARSEANRYALTPKVLGLGYAYLSSLNLPVIAQPLMAALADEMGLDATLATLDGFDVVYLNRVQRHRIASLNLAVGTRLPAHATSTGHVLLADLSDDGLESALERMPLPALTERTLTVPESLRHRVRLVRERGWAVVDQELEIGRRAIAAPVHDASGQVVAALSLTCGTAERSMAELVDDCVPALRDTASLISSELGGRGYAPPSGRVSASLPAR
jgi:IclR family transcriptional regulator, pca regulon regulatory protein